MLLCIITVTKYVPPVKKCAAKKSRKMTEVQTKICQAFRRTEGEDFALSEPDSRTEGDKTACLSDRSRKINVSTESGVPFQKAGVLFVENREKASKRKGCLSKCLTNSRFCNTMVERIMAKLCFLRTIRRRIYGHHIILAAKNQALFLESTWGA